MTNSAPARPTGFWVRLIVYPLFWAGWIYVTTWVLPWHRTSAGRDLTAYLTMGLAMVLPPILYLWRPPRHGMGYVAEFLVLNFLLFPVLLVLPYERIQRLSGLLFVFSIMLPSVVGFGLSHLVYWFWRKMGRGV